jgi:HAD superfamily hydrolase (TIGR01509 family)
MTIRTVTVDFWGTLLHDGPSSDDRYKRVRLTDFERILSNAGEIVSRAALARGYEASGEFLGRVWSTHRDVPVVEHVRAILSAVEPALPGRLAPPIWSALVEAYARPALLVPPSVDPGARGALTALRARGLTLAVVSNTMRTPGVTLRKLLEQYRILDCFAHATFSDEVGVRKPAPEIFWLTLRAVGGEPDTAVHVGDDFVLDVQGARAAGMRVIQVTSARGRTAGAGGPDATVLTLAGLPDAVAALDPR